MGNSVPLQVSVVLESLTITLLRESQTPQFVTVTCSLIVGLEQLAALLQVLVTQIAGTAGGTEQVAEAVADTVVPLIEPVPVAVTVSVVDPPTVPW